MNFVSPKNFKSGRLISNKYTTRDMILIIAGVVASVLLEVVYLTTFMGSNQTTNIIFIILFLLPGGIALLITMPLGLYHNVRVYLKILLNYLKRPKKYIWGGLKRNATKFIQEETKETD